MQGYTKPPDSYSDNISEKIYSEKNLIEIQLTLGQMQRVKVFLNGSGPKELAHKSKHYTK